MSEEERLISELIEIIDFHEISIARGNLEVLRSEVISDLKEVLNGSDQPESKIECPDPSCANSYIGDKRATELINHYISRHRELW